MARPDKDLENARRCEPRSSMSLVVPLDLAHGSASPIKQLLQASVGDAAPSSRERVIAKRFRSLLIDALPKTRLTFVVTQPS